MADVIPLMSNPKSRFQKSFITQNNNQNYLSYYLSFCYILISFLLIFVFFPKLSLCCSAQFLYQTPSHKSPNQKHKLTFRSITSRCILSSRPKKSVLNQKFIAAFVDISILFDDDVSLLESEEENRIYLLQSSGTGCGPQPAPYTMCTGGSFRVGKTEGGRKPDHSRSSNVEIKNEWLYTSTPLKYSFILCRTKVCSVVSILRRN